MPITVLSGGVVMDLSNGLHLLGPFDSLRIIDDQQALLASSSIEPFEHSQGLLTDDFVLVKLTSPKELTMVSSMCSTSHEFDKPIDRSTMANAHSHHESAIIGINVSRHTTFSGLEKSCCFSRDFSDSKHKASVPKSTARYNTYRHSRLLLFNHHYRQNRSNRSV
jgi:hypothetical protein